MTEDTNTAPAGWYADPYNPRQQRWWDGQAWGPEAPQQRARTNGAGVTSVVIGSIMFVVTMFTYSELAVILALIGFAFGILGAARSRQDAHAGKAAWIVGLVLNVAVVIIAGIGLSS